MADTQNEVTETTPTHLAAVEEEAGAETEEKKKPKISFEHEMATEEAVAYFEAVIAGLRKGAVQFRRGEQQLDLTPADTVQVKVKASSKGKKEKVEFELSWSTEADAPTDFEIS